MRMYLILQAPEPGPEVFVRSRRRLSAEPTPLIPADIQDVPAEVAWRAGLRSGSNSVTNSFPVKQRRKSEPASPGREALKTQENTEAPAATAPVHPVAATTTECTPVLLL